MYPEAWRQSSRIGECLAQFAAHICELQVKANSYFLLRDPAGSGLFSLVCFKALWDTCKFVSINVPRCALGLRVGGEPIYIYIYICEHNVASNSHIITQAIQGNPVHKPATRLVDGEVAVGLQG